MNHHPPFQPSQKTIAMSKYNVARTNLLLVVIMTVVNIVLGAVQADIYFLFSATIPYIVNVIGVELYLMTESIVMLIVFAVIAVILTVPYLVCWKLSKKHYGWMIGVLVYFSLDTLLLIVFSLGDITTMILDLLFHAWVLYYLILGVKTGAALKKAPATVPGDITTTVNEATEDASEPPAIEDTPALHTAYGDEKIKVYAEATVAGHHIVYRKYGKHSEELVVDNNVYAEYTFKGLAQPHAMNAVVNGLQISAGYYQKNYIMVNGDVVAETVRWI